MGVNLIDRKNKKMWICRFYIHIYQKYKCDIYIYTKMDTR
jgi:hypothetical protein